MSINQFSCVPKMLYVRIHRVSLPYTLSEDAQGVLYDCERGRLHWEERGPESEVFS